MAMANLEATSIAISVDEVPAASELGNGGSNIVKDSSGAVSLYDARAIIPLPVGNTNFMQIIFLAKVFTMIKPGLQYPIYVPPRKGGLSHHHQASRYRNSPTRSPTPSDGMRKQCGVIFIT